MFLRNVLFPILFRRNDGIYIMSERWDNLVILDACRYDVFEQVAKERGIDGTLEKKVSRGTNTGIFLKENFSRGKHSDIVYVSGNPFVSYFVKNRFFKIIPVWREGWSREFGTVLPETVYEYALDAIERYPNKRFIVHFMQPHEPYIQMGVGPQAQRTVRRRAPNIYANGWYRYLPQLDRNYLFAQYKRNLELAIPYVLRLTDELQGRTIVTSDHGEALGETVNRMIRVRIFGHCPGARISALTDVPWLQLEGRTAGTRELGNREAETESMTEEDETTIKERLRALGYD